MEKKQRKKVTKPEIAAKIAENTGYSVTYSSHLFDAILEVIAEELLKGRVVGLPRLGTIRIIKVKKRKGIYPGTDRPIVIPEGRRVSFRMSANIKKSL